MTTPEPVIDDFEVGRYALRTFKARGELRSVAVEGSHWKNGTCEAKCLADRGPPRHVAPHEGCECGIYGTLDMPHLRRQWPNDADRFVAVIAAEGITIIGDKGLKTQYARVVAYWALESKLQLLAAQQFGAAKQFDDLDEMLAAYKFPPDEKPQPPQVLPLLVDQILHVPLTVEEIKKSAKPLTWVAQSVKPGVYTKIELADGTSCDIGPVTVNGPWPSHLQLALTWAEPATT